MCDTLLPHWLLTLLERGRSGESYTMGADEVISIADLADLVRDILAPEKPVHIHGKVDPHVFCNRYLPDLRKARQELGLRVTISLAQAIRAVVQPRIKARQPG